MKTIQFLLMPFAIVIGGVGAIIMALFVSLIFLVVICLTPFYGIYCCIRK